jgi:hypothetical protein
MSHSEAQSVIVAEEPEVSALQPWQAEPFQLWSLLDMTVFDASFVALVLQQIDLVQGAMLSQEILGGKSPNAQTMAKLNEALGLAERLFRNKPLGTCLRDVEGVIFEAKKPMFSNSAGAALLSQLKGSITQALDSRKFVRIPDGYEGLVENEKLFGARVYDSFPSARGEIKEAGNCLAVECNTAAVFHLMRAAEHGLRCLVRSVGVTAPKVPLEFQEWQNLIEQVESRVDAAKITSWSQPSKGNALAFFGSTVSDYYAFKDAIRNITMHTRSGGTYDGPGALSVRNRVQDCLVRLSGHVDELNPTKLLLQEAEFAK